MGEDDNCQSFWEDDSHILCILLKNLQWLSKYGVAPQKPVSECLKINAII
jgi:hypothetical protein